MSLSQIIIITGKCISLCNSFALGRIEFIFGNEIPWDNRHQPHTSLLWKHSYHDNQNKTAITPLFYAVLSAYLVGGSLGQ